jgi:hypothetical protein
MELMKRISTFVLGLIAIVANIYLIIVVWHVIFWQVLIVEGIFILAALLFYVALEGF